MTERLSPELHETLRRLSVDTQLIVDISDMDILMKSGYANYSPFDGWTIMDKGRQYLNDHLDGH